MIGGTERTQLPMELMTKSLLVALFSQVVVMTAQQTLAADARTTLQSALLTEDVEAIKAAVRQARILLGDQAGMPEVPDSYQPIPANARLLTRDEASRAAKESFAQLEKIRFWDIGLDPTKLTAPLRAPASVMACMMALHRGQLLRA